MTLNAQIFYMNFVSEKHEGRSHLSSHIFPFQNSVNMYPKLDNKKSSGPDGITNHLLKLSLPYIIDSLTYIFNLCIEKTIIHPSLRKQK